jgi:hypothetical protein
MCTCNLGDGRQLRLDRVLQGWFGLDDKKSVVRLPRWLLVPEKGDDQYWGVSCFLCI